MLCCVCTAETLHRGLVQDATKVVVLQCVWHWRFKPRAKLTRNQISLLRGAPFGCRNSFPTPGPLLRVALFAHKVLGQRPPKHEGAASPWATKDVHDTICIGSTMLPYLGFYDRNNLLSLTTLQYSIWSRVVLPTSSWTICYPEFAERLQEKLEEMATEAFQTAVALATRGPANWDGRVSPRMDF